MVQTEILQDGVSLRRSPIDGYALAAMHLLLDESGHVLLDSLGPGGELPVSFGVAQTHLGFLRAQGPHSSCRQSAVDCVAKPSLIRSAIPDENSIASPIDIIELHIGYREVMKIQQILERPQGVVLQVFVTNIANIVLFQHEWQVAHLHDPQSVRIHNLLDIRNELVGVFQIIEHSDRSHDLRPASL